MTWSQTSAESECGSMPTPGTCTPAVNPPCIWAPESPPESPLLFYTPLPATLVPNTPPNFHEILAPETPPDPVSLTAFDSPESVFTWETSSPPPVPPSGVVRE